MQTTPSRHGQLLVIFLTILITTIGFGVVFPVLPIYAKKLGASDAANGWIVAIFSFAQFAFAPLWGRLSDRVGRRPVMLVSILGSAAAYTLTGWASTIPLLFIARLLDGATGGNVAAAQACLADITKPEERSKYMALIGVAFGLGFVIGPFMGGVLSHHFGPASPFYAIAGLSLLNAALVYFKLPETLPAEFRNSPESRTGTLAVFQGENGRPFALLVATYFLFLMGFSVMTFCFSLFNKHHFRYGELENSLLFGLIGIVGILVQGGLLRRLLPRVGEKPLALTGTLVLTASFFLLPGISTPSGLIWVSCAIAFANSLIQPTLNGLASRLTSGAYQGRAMGLFQSAASLGRGTGPLLGGWLLARDAEAHYARAPLWAAAGIILLALATRLPVRAPKAEPAAEPAPVPAA